MMDDRAAAGIDDDVRLGDLATLIHAAFRAFDATYDASRDPLKACWSALSDRVDRLQEAGHAMTCSEQIRQEAKWLLNYRADWTRLAERLTALQASLADLDQPLLAQATDGSWAGCTTEFYRKLEPTVDELQAPDLDLADVRPLAFTSHLQDPAALRAYLWSLQISDIARTGRNDRDELGAALTGLSYRRGNISNWPRLAETTLRIKDRRYPNGWRTKDGGLSNHHNYDVVQIFFYGWPYLSRDLKKRAAAEIGLLLRWCLEETIDEGGFIGAEPFEELYFGVRFLDRVGFWDRAKRFWTQEALSKPDDRPGPAMLCNVFGAQLIRLGQSSERAATIADILRAARCLSEGGLA